MHKTLLLLLLLLPDYLFGQETKKVIDKKTNEIYFVLNSDNSTRHGEYNKFGFGNRLMVKGFYNQGAKDSIWESYDFKGQVSLRYDYTNNKLLLYVPNELAKERQYHLVNPPASAEAKLSQPPIFLEGDDGIYAVLGKEMRYPADASRRGKSGTVFVSFIVDKNGNARDFQVKNPLGYGLDHEALRAMLLLPPNWLPGKVNAEPVDVEVTLPVKFKLQ
ncbi:energy transducer TonB [Adhaeribacter swui]|uniref:Energy transducer TonB n=1 Tax=Adhaeribacter swui TaxID=2086471 RepID=A0A7G7G771_9BACT|nr:energy transducer TonB [Adhaeribacter swui]QNF33005.1 energy transducer TonB [Adhaeribacter swui]